MSSHLNPYTLYGVDSTRTGEAYKKAEALYRAAMRRMHPDTDEYKDQVKIFEGRIALYEEKQSQHPNSSTWKGKIQETREQKAEFEARTTRAMALLKNALKMIRDKTPEGIKKHKATLERPEDFLEEDRVADFLLGHEDVAQDDLSREEVDALIGRAYSAIKRGDVELTLDSPIPSEPKSYLKTDMSSSTAIGLQALTREEVKALVDGRPEAFKALYELQKDNPQQCLFDAVVAMVEPGIYLRHATQGTIPNLLNALASPFPYIEAARERIKRQAVAKGWDDTLELRNHQLMWLREDIAERWLKKCSGRNEATLRDTTLGKLRALPTKLNDDEKFAREALALPGLSAAANTVTAQDREELLSQGDEDPMWQVFLNDITGHNQEKKGPSAAGGP